MRRDFRKRRSATGLMAWRPLGLVGLLFGLLVPAAAQWPVTESDGASHRFLRVAEGVYSATGTGTVFTGSNVGVIINDDEVMLVDSHVTPAAARALLSELRTLTDRPVRYVVNTHYHYDHAHGNQAFGSDVLIIGHEFTRQMLLTGNVLEQRTYQVAAQRPITQIDNLRVQLAGATDAAERQRLQRQIGVQQAYLEELERLPPAPTPPNVTLTHKMVLHRGERELQILSFGRGHTAGDVIVYLPAERVIITGDLITAGPSYMGDGYVEEWIGVLDAVLALDFDTVIPGHGEPFTGKERVIAFQNYLRDFWRQATRLYAERVPAHVAAGERIDLTVHRAHFPQIASPGVDVRAVERVYQLLDARALR